MTRIISGPLISLGIFYKAKFKIIPKSTTKKKYLNWKKISVYSYDYKTNFINQPFSIPKWQL